MIQYINKNNNSILPTDLRIGNLVRYKSGEEEYYEIISINKEHVSLKGNISFNYTGYDEIKPLLLKSNLLIKFIHFFNDDYRFEIKGNRTTIYFNEKYMTSLEYVHEIQNLYFSLTGSELNI